LKNQTFHPQDSEGLQQLDGVGLNEGQNGIQLQSKNKNRNQMNHKTKSYDLLTLVIWVDTTTLNAGPIGADFSSSSPTAGSFWRVDLMSWKSTMS